MSEVRELTDEIVSEVVGGAFGGTTENDTFHYKDKLSSSDISVLCSAIDKLAGVSSEVKFTAKTTVKSCEGSVRVLECFLRGMRDQNWIWHNIYSLMLDLARYED